MKKTSKILALAALALLVSCAAAQAAATLITDFEEAIPDQDRECEWMFVNATASALTHTYCGAEDGAEVVTNPLQNAVNPSNNVVMCKWTWNGSGINVKQWTDLSTYENNSYTGNVAYPTNLRCPTVRFDRPLTFKAMLASDTAPAGTVIQIALTFRETNSTAAIGQYGGIGAYPAANANDLEWVGVLTWHLGTGTTDATSGGLVRPLGTGNNEFYCTHSLTVGSGWQTLTWDPTTEPILGVNRYWRSGSYWSGSAGNNVLNSTTGKGVLQGIAFAETYPSNNQLGPYTVYLDDFTQMPEPGSLLALGTGLVGLAAVLRRRSA